jgi:hypothetical protein
MTSVWYKRYPSDFLNGVAELSAEERGVYVTLIDMLYDQGGSVIDDPSRFARRCGCSTRRFNQIRTRLLDSGKLISVEGRLFNKRVLKSLKPEFISDLSLKYLVLIFPEWHKIKELAWAKKLEARVHKKNIQKNELRKESADLDLAPELGTVERELYDTILLVHGEDAWKAWFSPEQISVFGGVLTPRTKFIRSKISQSYSDVIAAAGLTLGDVRRDVA